jgi:hypothetical protein
LRDTLTALDRHRIVKRQVTGRFADHHACSAATTGRLGLARQYDEQVGAERGELACYIATGAFADRCQQYDGGNPDRDREQQH